LQSHGVLHSIQLMTNVDLIEELVILWNLVLIPQGKSIWN